MLKRREKENEIRRAEGDRRQEDESLEQGQDRRGQQVVPREARNRSSKRFYNYREEAFGDRESSNRGNEKVQHVSQSLGPLAAPCLPTGQRGRR